MQEIWMKKYENCSYRLLFRNVSGLLLDPMKMIEPLVLSYGIISTSTAPGRDEWSWLN